MILLLNFAMYNHFFVVQLAVNFKHYFVFPRGVFQFCVGSSMSALFKSFVLLATSYIVNSIDIHICID